MADTPTINYVKHAENDKLLAEEEAKVAAQLNGEEPQGETPKEEPKPETPSETPKEETPTEQPTEDKSETPKEDEVEAAKENEDVKSVRGQKRVQELANGKAEAENKVEALQKEIERFNRQLNGRYDIKPLPQKGNGQAQSTLPWAPKQEETGDHQMTQEELQKMIDERAQLNSRNERIVERLDNDIVLVKSKYPVFDDESSEHDPELTARVSKWYEAMFKQDPTVRFADYVDQLMALRDKGAEEGKRQTAAVLKKQAAEQAIDSSGLPQKSTADEDVESKIRSARSSKELAEMEKLLPHADR